MIKYCKSCGKEYKGDWCEHCGFDKPDLEIKAFDKYKVNKPERFMTEEEKAQRAEEYKKQAKESSKNKTSAKPLQKPAKGSQWGFIILVAVVFAAIVIFMLWQNGIIFHKDKTEVITTYFNSIQTNDFEGYISTMVEPMAEDYREEAENHGLSEAEFLRQSYSDYSEGFGEGYTISLTFGNEEQMSADEISSSEEILENAYGESFNIKEAYKIATTAQYKGSITEETVNYYVYVGRIKNDWYILNIDG